MGSVVSAPWSPCCRRKRHYQLSKYLTARQIQLVQCTWSILKMDLSTLGVTVFH
ncbi:hypothetical protein ElyMa_004161000, partial [Elysia marginata]